MLKRFVFVLLTSILLFSYALPVHALTKEEVYQSSIEEFTAYMSGNGSMELEKLYENFESLGAYEWSMQFALYVDVLIQIDNGDFEMIPFSLEVLRSNKKYLTHLSEDYKDVRLGSIDDLENYAAGKQAEAQGDKQKALEAYMNCADFLDSTWLILTLQREMRAEEKAIEQIKEDNYQKAIGFMQLETEEGYRKAIEILNVLSKEEYKDSAALMGECEEALAEIARIAEQKRLEKLNEEKYQKSVFLMNQNTEESYKEAFSILKELADIGYKDCIEMYNKCEYKLAIPQNNQTSIFGDYEYRILKNGKAEIVKYQGNSPVVVIPRTINGCTVYKIGENAFAKCDFISQVSVPSGVAVIDEYTFYLCRSLEQIDLPDTLVYIGMLAFSNCTALSNIVLPDTLVYIGMQAFSNCTALSNIVLPERLIFIGDGAFRQCESLTQIYIPNSVTQMENNPFFYCDKLTDIRVDEDHPCFSVIDGVLFDKVKKQLICYPFSFEETSYTVPNGTLSIGNCSFINNYYLREVYLPEGLKSIKHQAFDYMPQLVVSIPRSVEYIEHAFSDSSDVILRVYRNTYAEQYARENGYKIRYRSN